jgi:hypothetical protein
MTLAREPDHDEVETAAIKRARSRALRREFLEPVQVESLLEVLLDPGFEPALSDCLLGKLGDRLREQA